MNLGTILRTDSGLGLNVLTQMESSAQIKNEWSYTPTRFACLLGAGVDGGNFTILFFYFVKINTVNICSLSCRLF